MQGGKGVLFSLSFIYQLIVYFVCILCAWLPASSWLRQNRTSHYSGVAETSNLQTMSHSILEAKSVP